MNRHRIKPGKVLLIFNSIVVCVTRNTTIKEVQNIINFIYHLLIPVKFI